MTDRQDLLLIRDRLTAEQARIALVIDRHHRRPTQLMIVDACICVLEAIHSIDHVLAALPAPARVEAA